MHIKRLVHIVYEIWAAIIHQRGDMFQPHNTDVQDDDYNNEHGNKHDAINDTSGVDHGHTGGSKDDGNTDNDIGHDTKENPGKCANAGVSRNFGSFEVPPNPAGTLEVFKKHRSPELPEL